MDGMAKRAGQRVLPNWPVMADRLMRGVIEAKRAFGVELTTQTAQEYVEELADPILQCWVRKAVAEELKLSYQVNFDEDVDEGEV